MAQTPIFRTVDGKRTITQEFAEKVAKLREQRDAATRRAYKLQKQLERMEIQAIAAIHDGTPLEPGDRTFRLERRLGGVQWKKALLAFAPEAIEEAQKKFRSPTREVLIVE